MRQVSLLAFTKEMRNVDPPKGTVQFPMINGTQLNTDGLRHRIKRKNKLNQINQSVSIEQAKKFFVEEGVHLLRLLAEKLESGDKKVIEQVIGLNAADAQKVAAMAIYTEEWSQAKASELSATLFRSHLPTGVRKNFAALTGWEFPAEGCGLTDVSVRAS